MGGGGFFKRGALLTNTPQQSKIHEGIFFGGGTYPTCNLLEGYILLDSFQIEVILFICFVGSVENIIY